MKISPLRHAISEAARRHSSLLSPASVGSQPKGSARGRLLRAWFIVSAAVQGFIGNNNLLRAAALTYTVALSIVPILALAFSVVKGFGLSDQLGPLIGRYLALGSSGAEGQLMRLVNNVNPAALGSAGGVFLLATAISTMSTVEQAFNVIFRVPRSRGYLRRFSDYLSVLFTVPLFIVTALALTTFLSVRMGPRPMLSGLTPYLFVWAGFCFLFVFFPYTRVRWGPALLGSFVTAVLFQVAQWGYVHFQVGVAKYRAIYGAFATVPVFLVWIYIAWAIVLFGAELTAAAQRGVRALMLNRRSPDFARAGALYTMLRLAERHTSGGEPASCESLAAELHVALDGLGPILDGLKRAGLVVEDGDAKDQRYRRVFLCRAPSAIALEDILEAVSPPDHEAIADQRIRKVLGLLRKAQLNAVGPLTLADLADDNEPYG